MATIKTATGKEYYCNFMGTTQNFVLYIKIAIDLPEMLEVFQDPNETKKLSWVGDTGEVVREETGYVVFREFTLFDKDKCPVRIRLEKKPVEYSDL